MAKELPFDILYEILLLLPAKTLCKLRCVSKPWSSLISSQSFQHAHLHRSQQNPLLLITQVEPQGNGIFHPHLFTYNKQATLLNSFSIAAPMNLPQWVDSCLGLLCLASNGSAFVFSPSTKTLIPLPLPTPPINRFLDCFGFGYVASTNEFKVVRFFNTLGVDQQTGSYCEVFTLGGTATFWREANPAPYPVFKDAIFVQGALHLQPMLGIHIDYIATFDIEREEYGKVQLPKGFAGFLSNVIPYLCLKEIGGSLCLNFSDKIQQCKLQLWILKDYDNGGWVRYIIDLSAISPHVSWASPLVFMADGCMLPSVYLEVEGRGMDSFIYWYDTEDKILSQKVTGTGSAVNICNGRGITLSNFDPNNYMSIVSSASWELFNMKQGEDIILAWEAVWNGMIVWFELLSPKDFHYQYWRGVVVYILLQYLLKEPIMLVSFIHRLVDD